MIFAPQCSSCARLHREKPPESGFSCAAFPNGVPDEILHNKFRHTSPYPGDKGILFEERPVPDDWGPDILLDDEA